MRFFKEFTVSRLQLGFAGINMPFGQIPSFVMAHQQERQLGLKTINEETTRLYLAHANAVLSDVGISLY
jgi:hypothetical protein